MQPNRCAFYIILPSVLAAVAVSATGVAQPAADAHVWKTYTNVRFQYTVCYPEGLLVPQGEADNSDGQKFLAADGAQLAVWGSYNALDESLKDRLAETGSRLAGAAGKVTYKVLKPHWFVVSGQNGATVFYAKTLHRDDRFMVFELTYSDTAAVVYEPVVRRIAACFADTSR
jgi:hypothetical protein